MTNDHGKPETTSWQSEFFEDRTDDHPWYGPCDGLAADGGCSECETVRFFPHTAFVKRHHWHQQQAMAAIDAERRARRKARRQARKEAVNV